MGVLHMVTDVYRCAVCGVTRTRVEHLVDGRCRDTEWCAGIRALRDAAWSAGDLAVSKKRRPRRSRKS